MVRVSQISILRSERETLSVFGSHLLYFVIPLRPPQHFPHKWFDPPSTERQRKRLSIPQDDRSIPAPVGRCGVAGDEKPCLLRGFWFSNPVKGIILRKVLAFKTWEVFSSKIFRSRFYPPAKKESFLPSLWEGFGNSKSQSWRISALYSVSVLAYTLHVGMKRFYCFGRDARIKKSAHIDVAPVMTSSDSISKLPLFFLHYDQENSLVSKNSKTFTVAKNSKAVCASRHKKLFNCACY